MIKRISLVNMLIWLSAIESDSTLPAIIVTVSAVSGVLTEAIEKEKARLARQRKVVQKTKNL